MTAMKSGPVIQVTAGDSDALSRIIREQGEMLTQMILEPWKFEPVWARKIDWNHLLFPRFHAARDNLKDRIHWARVNLAEKIEPR